MIWAGQVALACTLAALLLWVEHWFPWGLVFSNKPHPTVNYVLGVLAMTIPLTLLYIGVFGSQPQNGGDAAAALWAVVGSSGVAVIGAYGLDALLRRLRQAPELNDLISIYQEKIHDGPCDEEKFDRAGQDRDRNGGDGHRAGGH